MIRRRKLVLFFLLPPVLVALVIALAFVPAVQTAVARRVLASQSGMTASVERVAAGLSGVRVTGLRIGLPGVLVEVPSVELEVPLIDAARSRVEVRRLVANGWSASFSPVVLAAAGADGQVSARARAKPFDGLFSLLGLPVDLSVGSIECAGRVTVITAPGAGAGSATKPLVADVALAGGNFSAGQTGKLTLSVVAEGVDVPGGAEKISFEGVLEARMPTARGFDSFLCNLAAQAGQESAMVKVAALAAAAGKPEAYSFSLETRGSTRVLVGARREPAAQVFEGDWLLDLGDADLAPYVAGVVLPKFAASGSGSFSYGFASGNATGSGRLLVRGNLADFVPEMPRTDVVVATEFDAALGGGVVRVEKFSASVSSGLPLVSVRAVQPFAVDLARGVVTAGDVSADLVRVDLAGVPLALVEPFLSNLNSISISGAGSGFRVRGDPVRGAWVARLQGDSARVVTIDPLTVNLTEVSLDGRRVAAGLALSVDDLAASYSAGGWSASIGMITLRAAGAEAAQFTAGARQAGATGAPVTFEAGGTVHPAALASQPLLAALEGVTAGMATFSARGTLSAAGELAARVSLALDDLRTRAAPAALPALALDADVSRTAAGAFTVSAPLTLRNAAAGNRASDLTLKTTLTPAPAGNALDVRAQITSNLFYIEDAQAFVALAPADISATSPSAALPASPAPPPPATATPAAGPLWAGLTGEVTLALKRVVYSGELEIADVGGAIRFTPEALKIEAIKAFFSADSDLKLNGALTFDANRREAYALAADFVLNNFATAPWLLAFNPGQPAVLDTRLNVASKLTGAAPSPAGLVEGVWGDFSIASVGGGICRALSGDLADQVNKTGNIASTAVSILSGVLGGKGGKAAKAAETAQEVVTALRQIAASFEEIKFDRFSLVASRDDNLNVVLRDVSLVSPELRLSGGGRLAFAEGVPLVRQALTLDVNLAGRGRLASWLDSAHLLGGAPDGEGYSPFFTPVVLGGSLEKVDSSALTRAIISKAFGF
ncbi:MAG: hypothetical protein LBK99_25065 [Opitutaceae bacterium]|jgi:hypothetical protein|nr:hypothetical protein [Opitutaceae bacterium]